ncbi:ADP-ribosyl-(dinitrogen reductase) hydrolase (plasmid) [Pigmentibacter ruber]
MLKISDKIRSKLKEKHEVELEEVEEAFYNRTGAYLEDTREKHKTIPPSLWFISETDRGRRLKIVFIERNGNIEIKSAFEPNELERKIYEKYAK